MKHHTKILLAVLFSLTFNQAYCVSGVKDESQAEITQTILYVSPNGNDQANGRTQQTALKTMAGARDLIRREQLNRDMKSDLIVCFAPGYYGLKQTVEFGPEDSGSNGYNVVYRKLGDEKPEISGGRKVEGWTKVPGKNYYVADVSESKGYASWFKQLYVNGIRAQRAMSIRPYRSIRAPKTGDVQSKEIKQSIKKDSLRFWWDDPNTSEKYDGIEFSKEDLKTTYSEVKDLQLAAVFVFKQLQIPVTRITETDSSYIFHLSNPDFEWWTEWQDASGALDHYIVNGIEDLDEPGEWCFNTTERKIWYYPQPWEQMDSIDAYVPVVEGLIHLNGTPDKPIRNIQFDGLIFEYGNWVYPENHMLGRSQAEITGRYDSEVPGQIVLNYTDDVQILNSIFRHMASCGIQPYEGTHRTRIEGNYFYDLSCAAVSTGKWYSNKLLCPDNTICQNTLIRNNVIRNIGRDYYQASAINTFAAYDVVIANNDISDIAYAGIHARIGDKPTLHPGIGRLTYRRNLISRTSAMHKWGIRDGGTLYTHGYYPNCLVEGNYVVYSSRNVMDVFYADNWSNDSRWQHNVSMDSHAEHVCRAWMSSSNRVIFDSNFGDAPCKSAGGAQLVNYHYVENGNWPDSARFIMKNAGLELNYERLATHTYGHVSLLKNKPVTCSSAEVEHSATKGNDNNWDTYWHTSPNTSGEAWYQVDMQAPYIIGKLVIIPVKERFEPESRSNYEVQASNDPSFKDYTVLAVKNEVVSYYKTDTKCSNMWEVFLNQTKPYRYIRIVAKNGKGSFCLSEFEAFGYPESGK